MGQCSSKGNAGLCHEQHCIEREAAYDLISVILQGRGNLQGPKSGYRRRNA